MPRPVPRPHFAGVHADVGGGYPEAEDLCSTLLDPKDPDEVSAYFESLAS